MVDALFPAALRDITVDYSSSDEINEGMNAHRIFIRYVLILHFYRLFKVYSLSSCVNIYRFV